MLPRLLAVLLAVSCVASPTLAQTQSAPSAQELRIVVGYAAGGGYDAYARVVARFLGQHLSGRPAVVVQNMPGGDGLAAANYMSQIAPKDGFVIGLTNRNFAVAPLLGIVSDSSVKYDPKAFNWVANLNSEVSIFIVRSDRGVSSVRDLPSSSLQLGATGLTANNAMYPNVVNQLLGSRLTVVTGYPGAHHVTLALERGEVDGIGGYSWSTLQAQRPEWVQNGFIVPILQIGATTIPELGSVPSIMALARSEQERRALELIVAPERMGRPFFLPPKTAPDVVAKTRDAFSALSRDEAFQGAAAKSGLEITFMDGRSVQEYVEQLNSAPAEVVTLAKQLLVTKTSAP